VGAETYDIVTGEGLTFCRVTEDYVHARYAERYILPALRKEYSAERGEGIVWNNHVEVQHGTGHNTHRLVVRSVDPSFARSVAYKVKSRLIQLRRCSITHPLDGWTNHHADAFVSSKVCYPGYICTCIYFHNSKFVVHYLIVA
jgi:hypothetical protein